MKALKILKYFLDIIYIYLIFAGLFVIFIASEMIWSGNNASDIKWHIGAITVTNPDIYFIIVFILAISGLIMIFGVIYYCRKTINIWYRQDFFNPNSSKYLKIAGVLTLSSLFLIKIPVMIYNFFNPPVIDGLITRTTSFEFGLNSESDVLSIIFGLFLLILSQVLNKASGIKNENDLTI